MQLLISLFFSTIGVLTMLATTMFGMFTLLACLATIGYVMDQTMSVKERGMVAIVMSAIIAWSSWLTWFAFDIGISCLTP